MKGAPAGFFQGFDSSALPLATQLWGTEMKRQEGNKWQTASTGIGRGLNTIHGQCCSCTATVQPSRLLLSPHPTSNFLSPLSEISRSDIFCPSLPWPSSWLLCVERRWLHAARTTVGRSPGAGERADPCPCSGGGPAWSGTDARGKTPLSSSALD